MNTKHSSQWPDSLTASVTDEAMCLLSPFFITNYYLRERQKLEQEPFKVRWNVPLGRGNTRGCVKEQVEHRSSSARYPFTLEWPATS